MHKSILILAITIFFTTQIFSEKNESSQSFEAMNTLVTIRTSGENSEKINKLVKDRILKIEDEISVTKNKSDVWKINHAEIFPISTGEDTIFLLKYSLKIANDTNGAFNPCIFPITQLWGFTTEKFKIPDDEEILQTLKKTDFSKIKFNSSDQISLEKGMMIDFGAIGKGFAGDEAIKILKSNGIKSAIIDLGGNIHVLGGKISNNGKITDWNIGIKNPWEEEVAAGVKIQNKAVITSAGYERFFTDEKGGKFIHIFDPKTGRPAKSNIESITIICDNGIYGDALSTALFVMGKDDAIKFWKTHKNFDFVMMLNDKTICYTKNLQKKITLKMKFSKIQIVE